VKNRMVKGRQGGVTILAMALAALFLVTACAPGATPPEGKKIELGEIGSLTGPGSSADQNFLAGALDYVKYYNEQGMIPGVTVELIWRDSGRNLDRWVSAYEVLKARGIPVLISNETLGLEARQSQLERDQIPLYCGNPAKEIVYPPNGPAWYYFRSPTWGEQFAVWAEYIMENWQEDRPPKLAQMVIDSSFGRQSIPEATDYAESLGIEMLPTEVVPFVVLDATTQLLRLKEQEADLVYISGLIVTSGPILRDAERLGLLGQMQFGGLEYSIGQQLIDMAGSAAEGYIVPNTLPSFADTEVPGINLMLDTWSRYHMEPEPPGPEYIAGWAGTAITCEAVRRAIEQVGYENADGPAIKEAFDSIKGFDVDGLVTITYPGEVHRGSNKVAMYQIRGGEIVPVTDWRDAPELAPLG
jgi:branched-chain amino acid transport system substrate-binding protein